MPPRAILATLGAAYARAEAVNRADRHAANAARAELDAARMRIRIANACRMPPYRRPVALEVLRAELATLETLAVKHRQLAARARRKAD